MTSRAGGARRRSRVRPPAYVSLGSTGDTGQRRAAFALGRGVRVDDRHAQLSRGRLIRTTHAALRTVARPHATRAIILVRGRLQQQRQRWTLQFVIAYVALHRNGAAPLGRCDSSADRSHRVRRAHMALHRITRPRGRSDDALHDTSTDVESDRDDLAERAAEHRDPNGLTHEREI